jgi:hypothetical protein
MAFPPQFLEELRSKLSIAKVIGSRVRLEKRGREHTGLCPFHKETTPSFSVVEEKGFYHCFGCGAHGDVIGFVMEVEKLTLPEAIDRLAAQAGLSVPPQRPGSNTQNVPMKPANVIPEMPLIRQKLEPILATAAKMSVRTGDVTAASILANAEIELNRWNSGWNEAPDEWRLNLAIPTDAYMELEGRQQIEAAIDRALATAVEAISENDIIHSHIVTALVDDPDWREKTRQYLRGEGVTNQGRVHSQNIASRQHDGLLFRSKPEILFYQALKRTGVPFAPLSVVISGGITYRRIEPDFLIYKDGLVLNVEIDGDLYHTETPTDAHKRLAFLLHEGIRSERIKAEECDTPEKAKEAVARIMRVIEKIKRNG